jgi:hypothetical protein
MQKYSGILIRKLSNLSSKPAIIRRLASVLHALAILMIICYTYYIGITLMQNGGHHARHLR